MQTHFSLNGGKDFINYCIWKVKGFLTSGMGEWKVSNYIIRWVSLFLSVFLCSYFILKRHFPYSSKDNPQDLQSSFYVQSQEK